ncbi:MAG: alpha/beta fold hydrolase [Planctomycetes bacterium]|nr:alpha/beta fold hydrolase [Planctomycetota bacterium]
MSLMAGFEEITVVLQDGYEAYARFWGPSQPRGAVLYHHGIQSHCGWYEGSAAHLAQAGYAVLQVERRGSGRNSVARGHAESADELIADAHAARDELTRRSGFEKHHVAGISWGGKLAVVAYVADPSGVASLSLVTPGLFPRVGVSPGEMARIGLAMLYEQKTMFNIPLDDAELFTADPKWQRFVTTDELTLRQCTAGFYLASRRMDKTVTRLGKLSPVPLHLFVAGEERIIDNDKTTTFVRDLGWPTTRITTYDNARHSLEFEGDPQVYFNDLTAFIENAS